MQLGKRGEEEACRFLLNSGHEILDRNWRSGHLEIDIVTLDSAGVHFVEVKSRVAPVSADPLESVGWTKQGRIAAAAKAWLHSDRKKGLHDVEVFFDVVSVLFDGDDIKLDYYPQAYIPVRL